MFNRGKLEKGVYRGLMGLGGSRGLYRGMGLRVYGLGFYGFMV